MLLYPFMHTISFFNVGMNHVTEVQIGTFLLPSPPFITTERQFEETAALASPSDNPNTIPLHIYVQVTTDACLNTFTLSHTCSQALKTNTQTYTHAHTMFAHC